MIDHSMLIEATVVWLLGLFMAWCTGWAVRDRWHRDPDRGVARPHAPVPDTRDDDAHYYHCERVPAPAAPVVVNVHVTTPLPAPAPMFLDSSRVVDAVPALPEVGS